MLKLFERKVAEETKASSESTHSRELSVFKDPFNKAHITDISIRYTSWCNKFYWRGYVTFRNGNTKGEQDTPECETWDELMVHMKQIYDSLAVKTK